MSVTLSPSMRFVFRLAPHTGTCFVEDSVGRYTAVAKSGVRGQLVHVGSPSVAGPARAELATTRQWVWDPAFTMPSEHCQWEIEGERWNVQAGTVTTQTDRRGRLLYRRCDVTRAV